jgi:tripartite-type tricarboxylate transporter receptor subunit TctC
MKRRDFGALLLAILWTAPGASAQGIKVRRIVVGYPPGQATDQVARLVADALKAELGDTIVVENKPGQSQSIAAGQVARSEPDGLTILISGMGSLVMTPHLYKNLTYDTLTSFDPVGLIGELPLVLVVNPALPVKTLPELVAYAKSRPDKLSHSSSGYGGISHLAMEDLKRVTGMRIVHVPYQGSAPAMIDLMSGNIAVAMDTVAAARSFIESGRMRLIAVSSLERLAIFPGTPTIAEQGYPGFEATGWIGMLLPARTPRDVVEKLSEALNKVLRLPEIKQKFGTLATVPKNSTSAGFKKFLVAEHIRWGKVIAEAGVKVD